MLFTQSSSSIKRSISLVVTLVSSFIVGGAFFLYSLNQFELSRSSFINKQISFTKFVGKFSNNYLESNNHQALKEQLQLVSIMEDVEYLHIYRVVPDTKALTFFASYNKGNPAIPDKISEIERLKDPRLTDDFFELIHPIFHDSTLTGYVYIKASASKLAVIKQQAIIWVVFVFLLTAGLSFLIGLKIQNRITAPVELISKLIQQISKQKDYTAKIPPIDIIELDVLGRNLNLMLARIEKHIDKQKDAEQQILKLNQELEDKVSQRTQALKESNQELVSTLEKLHQYQGQLVENEKMASLGDMVAGVAHEVNTPVGLGVTASTLLGDRLKEIREAFDNKTLKSSQLSKFLADGEENISIIYRNLKRAADLISSFKQVAVDQSSQDNRVFDVNELLHEVMLTLAPQLKKTLHQVNIDCPKNLIIESKPGPVNQVLINLIVNSLLHGFENKTNGVIDIKIMMLSNQLHISYKDNGKGVDGSIKNKIFDPFITTKRGAGGSGLGLHLVYNLVTQALGGSIYFDSDINQGVSFDIEFPVHQME